MAQNYALENAKGRFDYRAQHVEWTILSRMHTYEEILRGGAGLFASSTDVKRSEWHSYVSSLKLQTEYPGLLAMNVIRRVPQAEKARHLNEVRAEGFPQYAIWPDADRPDYYPVVYVEPFTGSNVKVLGYDPATDPVRYVEMEKARDSAAPTISGMVTLVQDEARPAKGFMMYQPVFRNGIPHQTLAERRTALAGYVVAAIRMNDLMAAILQRGDAGIDVQIYDGPEMVADHLMYDERISDRSGAQSSRTPVFTSRSRIEIDGHDWLLVFTSKPSFEGTIDRSNALVVLLAGLLVSTLFLIVAYTLAAKRAREAAMNATLRQEITGRMASEAKFRQLVESAPDALVIVDQQGAIVLVNKQAELMFGYPRGELLGQQVEILIPQRERALHPKHRAEYAETLQARAMGTGHELAGQRKDGTEFPVEVSLAPIRVDSEVLIASDIRDITQRKQAEEVMRVNNRAIAASLNAIVILSCDGATRQIVYVNPAYEKMTGYSAAEVEGMSVGELFRTSSDPAAETIRQALQNLRAESAVLKLQRKDGSPFWSDVSLAPVKDQTGSVTHFIVIQNDVTENRKYQEQLEYQANFDGLTGLPNRNLFDDRLHQAIARGERNGTEVAVIFLDLDRFKLVNDGLGHVAGDELLRTMAQRLVSCVRDDDTVARMGGDEFALVVSDWASKNTLIDFLERMRQVIAEPVLIEGNPLYVTFSAGLSLYPDDGHDSVTLLRNADTAMYRAKEKGRNNFQFYAREMNATFAERLSMESRLRDAVQNQEFVLHYQPQLDLKTNRVFGVEALIRWQTPDGTMVSPGDFIPLAEETGLIVQIGEWALREACAQTKRWRDEGLEKVTMSVNLSARQFGGDTLFNLIQAVLAETGLEGNALELELTESLLMRDVKQAVAIIEELSALGVGIAIDDFGTGYSSLSHLKRFKVDRLKIDQSFVRDITNDPDDAAITLAVISLAHSLGLRAIAEGVETEAQLAFLCEYGCDEIQGYLLSRPLAADHAGEFLRASAGGVLFPRQG